MLVSIETAMEYYLGLVHSPQASQGSIPMAQHDPTDNCALR